MNNVFEHLCHVWKLKEFLEIIFSQAKYCLDISLNVFVPIQNDTLLFVGQEKLAGDGSSGVL
jgi:hypothetical protein